LLKKTFRACGSTVGLRIRKSQMSLIKHPRPEMKIIATNCMPELVNKLPQDFKKMLESCQQVANQPLWQPHQSENASEEYLYRLWWSIWGRNCKVLLRSTCQKLSQMSHTTSRICLNRAHKSSRIGYRSP
jgi:hypothetical protein